MADSISLDDLVEHLASTVINSYISNPSRDSFDDVINTMDIIISNHSQGFNLKSSGIEHILLCLKNLLIFLQTYDEQMNMMTLIYMIFSIVTPKHFIDSCNVNTDRHLRSIILAIEDHEFYQQDNFFHQLSQNNVTEDDMVRHRNNYVVIQLARHLLCLSTEDWSFYDFTYMTINNDITLTLTSHEKPPNVLSKGCLEHKLSEHYLNNSAPPANVLQCSGLEDNTSGDIFILKCIGGSDVEENVREVDIVLTNFIDQFYALKETFDQFEDCDIFYVFKLITDSLAWVH